MTTFNLILPNWFCVVFSIGFIGVIFYLGCRWRTLDDICKEFPKIRRALDLISQKLCDLGHFKEQIYLSSASPLSLTSEGKQMLLDSRFEDFFSANKEQIYASIGKNNPKTPFDVEESAKSTMLFLDIDKTPKIEYAKNFAYQNGKPLADILLVYSIEIRDRYMKEKGIK